MNAPFPSAHAMRPLLRLAQGISRAESTFVASIDVESRRQRVWAAANRGALQVSAGEVLDWREGDRGPTEGWASDNGVQAYMSFPLHANDVKHGALSFASRDPLVLDSFEVERMHLIAESIQHLVEAEREVSGAVSRADAAELDAAEAHGATRREALHSLHMKRLAHTDVLTGLPNRRAFMAKWEDAVARSRRRCHAIGLMLIDADHFKSINDSAGHAMGDVVLRAIGATLLVVAHGPDVVARLGGDEFALFSTHADGARLHELAAQIHHHFHGLAVELGVAATLSIGMVSSEDCPRERMLADADIALYRCKTAGGNVSRLFVCGSGDLPDVAA